MFSPDSFFWQYITILIHRSFLPILFNPLGFNPPAAVQISQNALLLRWYLRRVQTLPVFRRQ